MDSKDIILKKTFNLLLIKGFDAVSITDIQQVTGLSRGLLYHYFKNKEDLFIQVTDKYFVKIFDFNLERVKDLSVFEFVDFICKRFENINRTISNIVEENGGTSSDVSMLNYHFLFYQVIQRDTSFRHNYKVTIGKEQIGWEIVLRNSVISKELRQDIDILTSAKQLFILTDGIWFQAIFSKDGESIIQDLKSTLSHYVKILK
ncbi:MAG: TetR/AcrR family transcriptional regulator [Dysgonomonas sp.]